jgi:hypothetical protein
MRRRNKQYADQLSQKALTQITRDIEHIKEQYANFILKKLEGISERPETEQEKILSEVLELTNEMNQQVIRLSQGLVPVIAEYPLSDEQLQKFREILQAIDTDLSFESFKNLYRTFAQQQYDDSEETEEL